VDRFASLLRYRGIPNCHNIQVVDSFVYLGSSVTKDIDEYIEIQRRLKLANKAYFLLLAVMRRKVIHKTTKVML
jgi:hypothetical protein